MTTASEARAIVLRRPVLPAARRSCPAPRRRSRSREPGQGGGQRAGGRARRPRTACCRASPTASSFRRDVPGLGDNIAHGSRLDRRIRRGRAFRSAGRRVHRVGFAQPAAATSCIQQAARPSTASARADLHYSKLRQGFDLTAPGDVIDFSNLSTLPPIYTRAFRSTPRVVARRASCRRSSRTSAACSARRRHRRSRSR